MLCGSIHFCEDLSKDFISKYISTMRKMYKIHFHHNWLKENFGKLKNCNIVGNTEKIHHQSWLNKVGKMNSDVQ